MYKHTFHLRMHHSLSLSMTHTMFCSHCSIVCLRTCMNLQATAPAAEQRGGAIILQKRVHGSWGAVLLPKRKANLRDQGLSPFQNWAGMCKGLHWRWRHRVVLGKERCVVLSFVFNLEKKKNKCSCFS